MKAHLAKSRVNGSLKYRTLCGKIVSTWAIVYWNAKLWRGNCKVCRITDFHKEMLTQKNKESEG